MDIKITNQFLLASMNAVKDCDEWGKSYLSGSTDGKNISLKEKPKSILTREIKNVETLFENGNLRSALKAGLADELLTVQGLTDTGRRLAERKLTEFRTRLDADVDGYLDGAEVKQILTELKAVKDQVVGLSGDFSAWEIDDDPDAPEEEWQSVVRGHNPDVKPTEGQKNLFIYGMTDALSRALDLSEDEVARLNFGQFEQSADGTITFRVFSENGTGKAAFEPRTVRMTVGGFIEPADGQEEKRNQLNELCTSRFFAHPTIENPAASFRASDLDDVAAFLKLFAPSSRMPVGFEADRRYAVFNMLPDALRLVHDLRRQGNLAAGAISPETWWKCLGLKGKFPGGNGETLTKAFNAAVREKVIDDFLEAKKWNGIAGMKDWLLSGYTTRKPVSWPNTFVSSLYSAFCATTGCTYSQKLALLKTEGWAKSGMSLFFRPSHSPASRSVSRTINTDRFKGVTVRTPKDGAPSAARGIEGAWDSFAVSNNDEYSKKFDALLARGFSENQVGQIFKIADGNPVFTAGFGIASPISMMKIDVEKSGEDMVVTLRQPAFRPIGGGQSKADTSKCTYEFRADDLVSRYVVRPDGSHELSGLSFEKARESARIVEKTMAEGL